MPGSHFARSIVLLVCGALAAFGCASTDTERGATGSLSLDLVLAGDVEIDVVDWQITGNGMEMGGSVDVSGPGSTALVEVYGLPVSQEPYIVELSAVSVDQQVTCRGSAEFDVEVGVSTPVMVILNCKLPQELGSVRVNGKFNICAQLTKMVAAPLQTSVGNDISLFSTASDEEGDPISYMWTSHSGSIADPVAASNTYTCTEVGDDDITVLVTDDDGTNCMSMWTVRVTCVSGEGNSCDDVTCEDDGNECTDAACNSANGQCETSNNTNACDGGAGTCNGAGVCVPNPECAGPADCPATGNECTDPVCDAGTCGTADNTNACDDGNGTCSAGECVPNAECAVPGDCTDDDNECTDPVCNAGVCETSNNTSACDGGAGTCNAGVCVPNAEVVYEQDFNQLDITGGVIGDNWFFFNNVFGEAGNLKFSYNNPLQLAPNATIDPENIFISALVNDQGGPEQDPQQLSVFSDYKCCGTNEGHQPPGTDKVEVNVLRDVFTGANPIAAGDIGKTLTFAFQAKRGNIELPTTALGYIKTLDPNAGFSQTNFVKAETTNVGTEWTPFTISLSLDNALLVGQILQIGFQNTASAFAGSGVFYDNVLVTLE